MINQPCFKCLSCGADTYLYPNREVKQDTLEVEIPVTIQGEDGKEKSVIEKVVNQVPRQKEKIRQNAINGKYESYLEPEYDYKENKTYQLHVRVSSRHTLINLCKSCYSKHFKKDVDRIMNKVKGLER